MEQSLYEVDVKYPLKGTVRIFSNRIEYDRKKAVGFGRVTETFLFNQIRHYELHGNKEIRIEVSFTQGTAFKMKKSEAQEFMQILNAAMAAR